MRAEDLIDLGFFSGIQATFLVLSATSTWTRIVTSCFGNAFDIFSLYHLHQSFEGLTRASESRQVGHVRAAVLEEVFIAGTQIVEPRFTVWSLHDSIFRASSVTHSPDCAFMAITGQLIKLDLAKGLLRRAFEQCE
jgi:hypothetical protein